MPPDVCWMVTVLLACSSATLKVLVATAALVYLSSEAVTAKVPTAVPLTVTVAPKEASYESDTVSCPADPAVAERL